MGLTNTQIRQLKARLDAKRVKTRRTNGIDLHYVEGWYVIAEANRIFGYDAWDRRTLETNCIWSGARGERCSAAYTAKVQVCVRAGEDIVVREGMGASEGKASTPGQAHELALKGAETDATKRALATFGNPFGLALYDREHAGVRKGNGPKAPPGPWILRTAAGAEDAGFDKPSEFTAGLRKSMEEAHDIESLFAIWEQNVEAVRTLNRSLRQDHLRKSGVAQQLVEHLKRCAAALVKPQPEASHTSPDTATTRQQTNRQPRPKVDKSALTIAEPKRIRCKEHLRYVGSQPCLVCGRAPSHAHHVRFAQSRGLSLKVSDEFTVPLCAIHHDHLHRTGKEQEWWQGQNIDPLKVARVLWKESRGRRPAAKQASEPPN